MSIEDFLDDPESPADTCYDLSDEDRAARREELSEMARIEAFWS